MEIGIVGLPNVGKSTLFNVLTHTYAADVQNFPFCTIEPNVGIVNVQDARLDILQKVVSGQRTVPATVKFVDIAGLVQGASKGEGLGNKFLAHIRQVDAIVQVVRDFEDANVHHVHGRVDPESDRDIILTELILADLESLTRRASENEKKSRSGDKTAVALKEIYDLILPVLDAGKPANSVELDEEQMLLMSDMPLLTLKPFLYALNVAEDKVGMKEEEIRSKLGLTNNEEVVAFSGKMELDMLGFSPEERKEFLAEYGLDESPTDVLIKRAYDLLGLQYFFTAGEMEVHAWTIKKGEKAPQAAGAIHTDFIKKFIKAEVVNWQDFSELGGWSKAREAGKVRLEGKDYTVCEGDVIFFRIGG